MNLIVAEVQEVSPHPQAHKLKICQVFDGQKKYQVVCGASNLRLGMKSIFAPVASVTPTGIKIELASLRDVASYGMLCSPKELAVSTENGIVDLPDHYTPGQNWSEVSLEHLSSTPWYSYNLVESFWKNINTQELCVIRNHQNVPDKKIFKLVSQTFFHQGKYLYRHFTF